MFDHNHNMPFSIINATWFGFSVERPFVRLNHRIMKLCFIHNPHHLDAGCVFCCITASYKIKIL